MSEQAAEVRTLVMLPGMDGTSELFTRFTAALGPALDVWALSYPTDKPRGYAELQNLVRSDLPTDRPYVLLAESFSGPIAIEVAARAPALLRGLVLCCTFATNPRPALRSLGALLPALPLSLIPVRALGKILMGRYFETTVHAELEAALAHVPPAVLRARMQAVLAVDVSASLAAVHVPTLYLRARQDLVVPAAAADRLLVRKPDLQVVDLDGPHFLLQTQARAAADVVKAFLQTIR